jgi:spartin
MFDALEEILLLELAKVERDLLYLTQTVLATGSHTTMIHPQAFILLNLPNATLKAGNATYDGVLALECVTVSVSQTQSIQTPAQDVYLVLRLKSFETPIDPSGIIRCSVQNGIRRYSFLDGSGEDVVVGLHEPGAHEPHIQEDLDTFDNILAQYTEFQIPQSHLATFSGSEKPENLRGHLVLVNEDNGEVVGELDDKLVIQEDPTLNDKNDPVVIEIPEGTQDGARAAFVRAIPPEERDIILKGASLVRCVHFISEFAVHFHRFDNKLRDIWNNQSFTDSHNIRLLIRHKEFRAASFCINV